MKTDDSIFYVKRSTNGSFQVIIGELLLHLSSLEGLKRQQSLARSQL